MDDGAADAPLGRIAVETVGVRTHRMGIFGNAAFHVQTAANQRGVVRIAQRVVRGAARLDADQLHCRRQRLLRRAGAGLRVEDHLRVVPCLDPVRLSVVQ